MWTFYVGIQGSAWQGDFSAFRNVPVDPGDAIHLGIKLRGKFYVDILFWHLGQCMARGFFSV